MFVPGIDETSVSAGDLIGHEGRMICSTARETTATLGPAF